jgi:hypothetical protein
MSSENLQITALEPFIQKFTVALIKVFKEKRIDPREKFIMHDDLIPKLSPKIQEYSMRQRHISPDAVALVPLTQKPLPLEKVSLESRELPFSEPSSVGGPDKIPVDTKFRQNVQHHTHVMMEPPARLPKPQLKRKSKMQMPPMITKQEPPAQEDMFSQEPYGRITLLLQDPSVSVIDCNGPGKPVVVTRYGRKQVTKINLSVDEIAKILDTISMGAHIPLMDGIFRAAVDDFSVTAIISEMVGSKFSIKKSVPVGGAAGY